MRLLIVGSLLLVLGGCNTEPSGDSYLAAVDKYLVSLDAARMSGASIDPPPQPVYLNCPVQPERLPQFGHSTGGAFNSDTIRSTSRLGKLSTRSQAQCEKTNTARRQAYEKAIKKYLQVSSSSDAQPVAKDSE